MDGKRRIKFLNWESVCTPKSVGGLGIKDLSMTNLTLLAKWAWKFYSDPVTPWSKLTRQIYTGTPVPVDIHNYYASPLMMGVHSVMQIFGNFIKFTGRLTNSVLFWKHNWTGIRLDWKFPNLYSFVRDCRNISVSDAVQIQDWSTIFNLPLSTAANAELDQLIQIWDQWNHSADSQEQHTVIYSLTQKGNFQNGVLYKTISRYPKCEVPYRYIWTLAVPPKIRIFLWRMLRNILPTLDQLKKRGYVLPNICLLCMQNEESTLHLFQECTFGCRLRNNLRMRTQQILEYMYTKGDAQIQARLAACCFWIWKERCARTFTDEMRDEHALGRLLEADTHVWSRMASPSNPS
jgi:mannosylglycoprotein endo-beta-mannosidase